MAENKSLIKKSGIGLAVLGLVTSIFQINIAAAQTPVAQFNVGMRIVDPCAMKGEKWSIQCIKLKQQQIRTAKKTKSKNYIKKSTSR
jgi:hypothetical protein